jgi:hypothetical protein
MTQDSNSPAAAAVAPPERELELLAQEVVLLGDCVRFEVNGVAKYITYDVFLEIVRQAAGRASTEGPGAVVGTSLPRNCIWFGRNADSMEMNFFYPEHVAEITYFSTKYTVVVPNIVIYHKLLKSGATEYSVETVRYFCTDHTSRTIPKVKISQVDHGNRIYLLPFTNTYDRGHMCYGYNTMPKKVTVDNVRALDGYFQFLFNSPFNDDLGVQALARASTPPKDWYGLLAKTAKDNKPFPYSKLRGWASMDRSTPENDEVPAFADEA